MALDLSADTRLRVRGETAADRWIEVIDRLQQADVPNLHQLLVGSGLSLYRSTLDLTSAWYLSTRIAQAASLVLLPCGWDLISVSNSASGHSASGSGSDSDGIVAEAPDVVDVIVSRLRPWPRLAMPAVRGLNIPMRELQAAARNPAPLLFGQPTPDPLLLPMIERVAQALGPHRASGAHALRPFHEPTRRG